jgi:hypothetical protein
MELMHDPCRTVSVAIAVLRHVSREVATVWSFADV